jgi:hypothetical protein
LLSSTNPSATGADPQPPGRDDRTTWAPPAVLTAAMLAWLWPFGVGGKMPVGGDVTSFSIGLMGVLSRALRAGRLPLWNDLWGYGFPGVAESQMGVFYPPHWAVYGLLSVEAAYAVSMVAHTLWGALGAFWAARRFGVSSWGACLSGFAWGASGFFLVHLPHQWGYSVGSWMPWACGLAWAVASGAARRWTALALCAVLAVQVLPGHFQLAFETQVMVLGVAAYSLLQAPLRLAWRRSLAVVIAWLAAAPLAAAQLWPTARLAFLAQSQRDFEYLSGFAATPLHLVSFVAPGLFHRSPLWRPLAWDPFHTSPEEYLGYVGLVPLFLALRATVGAFKKDHAGRFLVLLVLGTLIFSLGPYVPGFSALCRLPGFSFFRAPARWGLATSLGLALLAGKGFDLTATDTAVFGRPLARFVFGAALWIGLVILAIEGALLCASTGGRSVCGAAYDRVLKWLPWDDDPSLNRIYTVARSPQSDARVRVGLAREGYRDVPRSGLRWDHERTTIYRRELEGTGVLLAALLALVPLSRRRGAFLLGLGLITGLDLLILERHRPLDAGPIRSLVDQSPVLTFLANEARNQRVASGMSNLPMLAGSNALLAYRTLDLAVVPVLTRSTLNERRDATRLGSSIDPLRATGTAVQILEARPRGPSAQPARPPIIVDPALVTWLYGADWAAGEGAAAARFAVNRSITPPTLAWFVSESNGRRAIRDIGQNQSDAEIVLSVLADAKPCSQRSETPERVHVEVQAPGPGLVVLSRLHDPLWRVWRTRDGQRERGRVIRVFGSPGAGAWQGIAIPGPGVWQLDLEFSGADVWTGLAISGIAWLTWVLLIGRAIRAPRGGGAETT